MVKRRFNEIETAALVHAIAAAEQGSTGELRVVLARRWRGDAQEAALAEFQRLGLQNTKGRTGVLLWVCLRDHKAAILGDVGIHEKVGHAFWRHVIDRAIVHFKEGDELRGILSAVDEIGQAFRAQLPGERGEGNELPNAPEYGH